MKKNIIIILLSLFLVITSTIILFKSFNNKCTDIKDNNFDNTENYDFYNIGDTELFSQTIVNNKIDKNYNKEFYYEAGTTSEMVKIKAKYIDIWKKELAFSFDILLSYLDIDLKEEFISVQNTWEQNILNKLSLEKEIISDYAIVSTSFQYEYLSNILNEYRNRTIRIKYLTYLIEKSNDLDSSDYKSLNFQN